MAILYLTIGATRLMYSGNSRREGAATADGLAPNAAHRLTGGVLVLGHAVEIRVVRTSDF